MAVGWGQSGMYILIYDAINFVMELKYYFFLRTGNSGYSPLSSNRITAHSGQEIARIVEILPPS